MKFSFLIVMIAAMVGCSHLKEQTRTISSVDDIGIVGPNGQVLLYYKEGNFIIVKNCALNTVLGSTPMSARTKCVGRENKILVGTFKQALKNLVSTDRLNVLQPLTPEEVEIYNQKGLSMGNMILMETELDKINAFIASYGEENADLVRKEELIASLKSNESRMRVMKKINSETDKAIELIADNSVLTIKKFSQDKDQFLYTVLKQFDPNQKWPCGLRGRVEDRIADCSSQEPSLKGNFVLVSRSEGFKEVYKDMKSGLLWSDRLTDKMNHYNAEKACKPDLKEGVGISGLWRLPTSKEYEEAEKNGIRSALPNMSYWFWSSSVTFRTSDDFADVFVTGIIDRAAFPYRRIYDDVSVRCVIF